MATGTPELVAIRIGPPRLFQISYSDFYFICVAIRILLLGSQKAKKKVKIAGEKPVAGRRVPDGGGQVSDAGRILT